MHNGMTLTRIQGQGQGHRHMNALAEVDRQSPYGANFLISSLLVDIAVLLPTPKAVMGLGLSRLFVSFLHDISNPMQLELDGK